MQTGFKLVAEFTFYDDNRMPPYFKDIFLIKISDVLVHLNDPYVLNKLYVNNIYTILLAVQYLTMRLHDPAIFILLL